MATRTDPSVRARAPLTKERVLRAAISLADSSGIESLSMRKLGQDLGVEAMSLYNHVANKEDILDGIVDLVFSEIALPAGHGDWKPAMRNRAISAHEALLRHPWAPSLMQSRTKPGSATMRHHDSVLGSLRNAGFTLVMAAHAVSVIDGYVYGFALQQINIPLQSREQVAEVG
jgi:AcrR family transcriptional regulator